jgi:predicted ferric reductase
MVKHTINGTWECYRASIPTQIQGAEPMQNNRSSDDSVSVGTILSPGIRYFLIGSIVFLFLLLTAGALSIPFRFESPSMWYKFGVDKSLLRAGKMLGIFAGLLLLLQLLLAGRLKLLDCLFSLPGLVRQHRYHAWIIAFLALLHPVCVSIPEDRLLIPLEMRYWPEWIGVALLSLIVLQFVASQWRKRLKIVFHSWMRFHRVAGLLAAALLIIHVLYVSETFDAEGLPRTAVLIAAGLFLLVLLWIRTGWLWRSRAYTVARVEQMGVDCSCVELTPSNPTVFGYAPGQFAFVSFRSKHVSREPHPFTLSSTPSRPGTLQFTIRASGDWTRTIAHLSRGDQVRIQGPFGRFGHLFTTPDREMIMIAGGIGITPMLSMLRFMADQRDPRPVTLIWANRSPERVVYADEMDDLSDRLAGLRHISVFTLDTKTGKRAARLDQQALKRLVGHNSRDSAVFICGPPKMMIEVKADLKALGFPARSIFTEAFGF